MCKKYELTEETKILKPRTSRSVIQGEVTVHRIRALTSFGDVKEGDLGGWIESENNLGHSGDCWVYDDAVIVDGAIVEKNAKVKDSAIVTRYAKVTDNATVGGSAILYAHSFVSQNALVNGSAYLTGHAHVTDNAIVTGVAKIRKNASIEGFAKILGCATVTDAAIVSGTAIVTSRAKIYDHSVIKGSATVSGHAICTGNTALSIGKIMHSDQFVTIKLGNDTKTFYRAGGVVFMDDPILSPVAITGDCLTNIQSIIPCDTHGKDDEMYLNACKLMLQIL